MAQALGSAQPARGTSPWSGLSKVHPVAGWGLVRTAHPTRESAIPMKPADFTSSDDAQMSPSYSYGALYKDEQVVRDAIGRGSPVS